MFFYNILLNNEEWFILDGIVEYIVEQTDKVLWSKINQQR